MFYQIIKHGAKVKNHPQHNWEEKVQMNAQLSFCGLGKLLVTKSSFEEFNDVSLPHGGVQNVLFLNSTKATNF